MLKDSLRFGLVKNSFNDSPNGVAKVVFFPGCNMRCGYCYNKSVVKGKDLPYSYNEIVDEIKSCKVIENGKTFFTHQWIIFSGGECTLHPIELRRLIDIAIDTGLKVGIYTNGLKHNVIKFLLDRLDYVHLDIKIRFDRLCVLANTDSFNPEDDLKKSIKMVCEKAKNNPHFYVNFATVLVNQYFDGISAAIDLQRNMYDLGFEPQENMTWTLNAFKEVRGEHLDDSFTFEKSYVSKPLARQFKNIISKNKQTDFIKLVGYFKPLTPAQKEKVSEIAKTTQERSTLLDMDSDDFKEQYESVH